MSNFKERVLKVVKGIRKGKTLSYGEVAAVAGYPGAARAVGNLMSKNMDKTVPCHRVIKSSGEIGKYNRGGESEKRNLLRKERALN